MSLDCLIEKNLKSETFYEFASEEFDDISDKILNEEAVDYQKYKAGEVLIPWGFF